MSNNYLILTCFSNLYLLRKCKEWGKKTQTHDEKKNRDVSIVSLRRSFFSFNVILLVLFFSSSYINQAKAHA